MKNIERIAEELFNKVRSRFDRVTLIDEEGKPTDNPEQARFMVFNYTTQDGIEHGDLTLSLAANKSLKVHFARGLIGDFDEVQSKEWEEFLRSLRQFARRNIINFDVRDISKNSLTKRDIKQVSSTQGSESTVTEGIQWHGTTRTSIQEFGPVRLIIKHSEAVNEEVPGSRSRKIDSMFIETDLGERFRMPFKRLSAGRAMAQHIAHGGQVHDDVGQHLVGMTEEMTSLAFFVRNTRNRVFEDEQTRAMIESAVERFQSLRAGFHALGKTRGYQNFAERFRPSGPIDHGYDIDELKERFVKKMFDDRLETALPYVYRAYQTKIQETNNPYIKEFESWTDDVTEGTWSLPDSPEKIDQLKRLMSKPITAGENGIEAISVFTELIGNDDLNDVFYSAGKISPNTDVRPAVIEWLKNNNYADLVNDLELTLTRKPVSADLPIEPVPEPPRSPDKLPKESILSIRRLAGI